MRTHKILLLALALLTGSCGLINDQDSLPEKRKNADAEMLGSEDFPSRGGG